MNSNQNGPIDNLTKGLSLHARFLSHEDRKTELRERGVDVDAFLKTAKSTIEFHQKAERLSWMKIAEMKKDSVTSCESKFESWIGKGEDAIRHAFQALSIGSTSQSTLAFRNKKALTLEDMARILDDYERLRISGETRSDDEEK